MPISAQPNRRATVLICEFIDESALKEFPTSINYIYRPDLVEDRKQLLEAVTQVDAIIVRNRTQVDRELLESASHLKVVGRLGVGLDNIDLKLCAKLGIAVFPATGANTRSVAEFVMAAIFLTTRGCFNATTQILDGEWPRAALGRGGEVYGRTLGLVGFGTIAQAVAQLAQSMGMRVLATDPLCDEALFQDLHVEQMELEALLGTADVISLHVPYTSSTLALINAERIAQMRSGSVLINTARGEVVSTKAVVAALKSGHLSSAVIDVFEAEPPEEEQLELLRGCDNLILTPHVAGVTAEANHRVSFLTVRNVVEALTTGGEHA